MVISKGDGAKDFSEDTPMLQIRKLERYATHYPVITHFFIPYSQPGESMRTYKISDREQSGQALVNAGLSVRFDKQGRVDKARIIYGGLSYLSVEALETEKFLLGRAWDGVTLADALSRLKGELSALTTPLPGDNSGRQALGEALFYRFFLSTALQLGGGLVAPPNVSGGKSL